MIHPNLIHITKKPLFISYLVIDCDSAGERIQVFNRESGELLSHKKIANKKYQCVLPKQLSEGSALMCVMLDDNSEFNATIADNVQPMLVDLVTFDPSSPLPYEPTP